MVAVSSHGVPQLFPMRRAPTHVLPVLDKTRQFHLSGLVMIRVVQVEVFLIETGNDDVMGIPLSAFEICPAPENSRFTGAAVLISCCAASRAADAGIQPRTSLGRSPITGGRVGSSDSASQYGAVPERSREIPGFTNDMIIRQNVPVRGYEYARARCR